MKKIILLVLTLLLAFLIAIAAEWEPVMDLLPFDRSGWKVTDGIHYYLNEEGDPLTGWQDIEGSRYYFSPAGGAMQTGWVDVDGIRYHCDADGHMLSNCWLEDESGTYYLDTDGTVATGWMTDGTNRFYLTETGILSGWQEIEGQKYYMNDDGSARTGWLDIDGQRYYLSKDGHLHTGWMELDGSRYYLNEDGTLATGWLETEEGTFYLDETGASVTGWVDVDGINYYIIENGAYTEGWNEIAGKRYYMNSDGTLATGWMELDGQKYYLNEDGSAATGKLVIEEKTYYFTSTGANIIMVNPWNYIPDDYEVELTTTKNGKKVAAVMYDNLMQMLADCEAAGHRYDLRSAYRTHGDQAANFNRILAKYNYNKTKAAQVVAVPGTSEHQLGLAVDITDASYRDLDYDQEKTATQQWLMEHCWDYGFILRYPNEKSEITGIIYEPWHYRYVGKELAAELKDSGLCLEEYLEQLTEE